MIRTVIVDDHEVMRDGLRQLISVQNDMEVVGEATDGLEAIQVARQISPDVILIDITMPNLNGIDLISLLRETIPDLKIVVLSMHSKDIYVRQVLKLGGLGYVLKASTSSEILQGIRLASQGQHYLCQELRDDGMDVQSLLNQEDVPAREYDLLTEREQQVFKLIVEGKSTKQIADLLYLSPKTIEKHRGSISGKLGVQGRMETLKYAIKIGLVDPGMWQD